MAMIIAKNIIGIVGAGLYHPIFICYIGQQKDSRHFILHIDNKIIKSPCVVSEQDLGRFNFFDHIEIWADEILVSFTGKQEQRNKEGRKLVGIFHHFIFIILLISN